MACLFIVCGCSSPNRNVQSLLLARFLVRFISGATSDIGNTMRYWKNDNSFQANFLRNISAAFSMTRPIINAFQLEIRWVNTWISVITVTLLAIDKSLRIEQLGRFNQGCPQETLTSATRRWKFILSDGFRNEFKQIPTSCETTRHFLSRSQQVLSHIQILIQIKTFWVEAIVCGVNIKPTDHMIVP